MKSYNENIMSKFPQIEMPLCMEQMAWVKKACNLHLCERFVAKSERTEQLQNELDKAKELHTKATMLLEQWNGKGLVMPDFRYKAFGYSDRDAQWRYPVMRNMKDADERANAYVGDVRAALRNICSTLEIAIQELKQAIEVENKGNDGESLVESYLTRSMDCRILSGVVLPGVREHESSPKTAETDLLVFARNGIYVCEIKNYGKMGQTLQVCENGHILKVDHNGIVLEDMGSPFAQNALHYQAVKKVLDNNGMADIPVRSVVIIANTDVRISNSTHYWVGDMYAFRDLVYAAESVWSMTNEQMHDAYAVMQKARLTERKFPITAVTPIAEDVGFALGLVQNALKEHNIWARTAEKTVQAWLRDAQNAWTQSNAKRCDYEEFMEHHRAAGSIYATLAVIAIVVVMLTAFFGDIPPGIGWLHFNFTLAFIIIGRFMLKKKSESLSEQEKPTSVIVAAIRLLPRALLTALLPTAILLFGCYVGCW